MKDKASGTVLFISYYFPPIQSVGVIRNYNLAKQFCSYCNQVIVLTTSNYKSLPQESFPPLPIRLISILTFDYRTFLSLKGTPTAHHGEEKKNHPFIRFVIRLLDSFPFNILFGEGGFLYILLGFLRGVFLIRQQKVKIIYSSFRPFSDHFIAFLLKTFFPSILWIADFRDLPIDQNRGNTVFPKFQAWVNKKIIRKADQVLTVSEGLAKNLRQYRKQVYVLRSGMPVYDQEEVTAPFSKFTFAYTGSIYQGFQTPAILLEGLQELIKEGIVDREKVQIVYAGKDGLAWTKWINQQELQNVFINKGFIAKEEAQKIQKMAQVNLLLSWSSPKLSGILTAKFYEYLAARNPILLIINGTPDLEFEKIFKDLNAGIVAYNDSEQKERIKNYILDLYLEWEKEGTIRPKIQEQLLTQFSWKNQFVHFWNQLSFK